MRATCAWALMPRPRPVKRLTGWAALQSLSRASPFGRSGDCLTSAAMRLRGPQHRPHLRNRIFSWDSRRFRGSGRRFMSESIKALWAVSSHSLRRQNRRPSVDQVPLIDRRAGELTNRWDVGASLTHQRCLCEPRQARQGGSQTYWLSRGVHKRGVYAEMPRRPFCSPAIE